MAHLFPLLIFVVSFSVYLFTALPSIYWRDGSEFQAIGFLLDIAHPAGSPLYAMVVKLFTFLPMGSIAFRTTLVSSFFGAAVSVLVYWIAQSILEQLAKKDTSSSDLIRWISFFTALLFSFSNALWQNSNMPEVYTFQNFFTALFILILIQIQPFGSNLDSDLKAFRFFLALSFLFGLSLGAHAILILYLPFLFFWVYFVWLKPASLKGVKTVSLLFFFFLLGFSVYLYLPIRSAQDPYYDWGNTETFYNLIQHASDRKDAPYHFSISKNVLPRQISMYLKLYVDNFSFLGVIVGMVGFCYLVAKKEKRLLLLFLMFFSPPFLFFIRYWGEASAFIPTLLIFDLLIGVGLWVISTAIQKQLGQNRFKIQYLSLIWALLGIQFLLLFSNHLVENSKISNYWAPREIMKNILEDLPSNAIVLSVHTWFGLNYLQQSEGHRPDISIFSLNSFLAPALFTELEKSRFPNIVIPAARSEILGPAFLNENIHLHPIYWEPSVNHNRLVEAYLVPEGFFFKVNSSPSKIDEDVIRSYLSNLSKQMDFDDISNDREERNFYAEVISGQGSFFLERGAYEMGLHHFKLASALVPNETHHLNILGAAYAYLEEYPLAEEAFLRSISANPDNHEPYLNLAKMYTERNMLEKAEPYFKEVLHRQPSHVDSLYSLGKINAEKGNKREALAYFLQILKINPNNEEIRREIDRLQQESTQGERR